VTEPSRSRAAAGVLARFIQSESAASVALLAATVVALAWANSRWAWAYDALLHLELGVWLGGHVLALTLHHWVNDGLMALFFFVVGLEIKRELVLGQLSTWSGAALPVAAAIGGMVAPALLYTLVAGGGPGARGWGVPMATDIAFALGVLALLGRRVPPALQVFLTAIAIADDLGAVLVISLYYTERVHLGALGGAAALLVGLWLVGRSRLRSRSVYALLVAGVWLATLASGVHATVAGILVAFLVPVRAGDAPDPAQVMEEALHPVTTWLVLPVFALFNAGVALGGGVGDAIRSPVALGVLLGLVVGKTIGITGATWLLVRAKVSRLPEGLTLGRVAGASVLGGIGFTMSIFVAGLAFPGEALETAAKVGILAASVLAGVTGYAVLRAILPALRRDAESPGDQKASPAPK
jgi:Na+:H+ antiporter, NhaA family